jgi:hypothetical protein
MIAQRAQRGERDELVSPARRHDVLISGKRARVRQLDWRSGQRGQERIRTENDDRWYAH